MNQKRIQKPLLASGIMGLIAVAGTGLFVVRNLLAAFLILSALFSTVGITVLASFLIGEGVIRCFDLLVACAAPFRLRQQPLVANPFMPGIGKS